MDAVNVLLDALRTSVGPQAIVFALAGVGLNLQFGYAGLLNFGQVAFMLAGAYGASMTVDAGGPLWLGIVLGMLAALVIAMLFGLPALRLRADYLAIVTISVGEIIRLVVRSSTFEPITNGVFGYRDFAAWFYDINPIPDGRYGFGGFTFSERRLWVIVVGWGLVAVASLLVFWLMRSPWGRVLEGVREDEDAVRSMGKNVFMYKLQALAIGGVMAAVAGSLRAMDTEAVRPDFFFTIITFTIYAAVILGGAGTILGPAVGAMALWFVVSFSEGILRLGIDSGVVEFLSLEDLAAIRFMIVGLVLILLVVFRPQGLLGRREAGLIDD